MVMESKEPPFTPTTMATLESESALLDQPSAVDSALLVLRQRKRELEQILCLRARKLTIGVSSRELLTQGTKSRSPEDTRQSSLTAAKTFDGKSSAISNADELTGIQGNTRNCVPRNKHRKRQPSRIRKVEYNTKACQDMSSVSCSELDDSGCDQSSKSELTGPSHNSSSPCYIGPKIMSRINSSRWLAGRNVHRAVQSPQKLSANGQSTKTGVIADDGLSSDSQTRRSFTTTTVTSATTDISSIKEDVELGYTRQNLLLTTFSSNSSIASNPSAERVPGNLVREVPDKNLNSISVAVCDVSTITGDNESEDSNNSKRCPVASYIITLLVVFVIALVALLALVLRSLFMSHKI